MTLQLSSRRMGPPSKRVTSGVTNGVLIGISLCFVLPLSWLVLASLDTRATYQTKFPESPSLDNFQAVLTPELTLGPLGNSLILAGGAATVTVIVAVLAAYPLSRYTSRLNRPFLYVILFGTGLPITAIMVPVYGLFARTGLLGSMPATILFMAATSLPIAIWMTKSFMDSVPASLEEAAWVDGASRMSALRRIMVPLMRPGLGVVFIFVFLQAWGNFFVPFVLLVSPSTQPAAVSIYSFFGQYGAVAYGQLAAFSIIYSAPVLLLYLLVSRGMGGSFSMSGAIKG